MLKMLSDEYPAGHRALLGLFDLIFSVGVARGCSGCTCTPQGGENFFSGVIYRKMC